MEKNEKVDDRELLVRIDIKTGSDEDGGPYILLTAGTTTYLDYMCGENALKQVEEFFEENLTDPLKELKDLIEKLMFEQFVRETKEVEKIFGGGSKDMSSILDMLKTLMENMK